MSKKYWVISDNKAREEDGARWTAFPAMEETLEGVKEIAGIFGGKVYVAVEVSLVPPLIGGQAMTKEQTKASPPLSDLLCADLPAVGGRMIDCSLNDMERRARIFLKNEQDKIAPDTAMVAFLCDVVRLSREYGDSMRAKVKALGERLGT